MKNDKIEKYFNWFHERYEVVKSQAVSFYNENREMSNVMGVLLIICFVLWQLFDTSKDFGLNAFTETLGIAVTILLVDKILTKKEEAKSLPLRAAAYEDVRFLTTNLVIFWNDIYVASVKGESPSEVQELFSQESVNRMALNLDLDGKPNVTPPRTWWEWLPEQNKEISAQAEKILERHVQSLSPHVYSFIHSLLTDGMLFKNRGMNVLPMIRGADRHINFPRPTNLAEYMFEDESSLHPIVKLDEWCHKEFSYLTSKGLTSLKAPFTLTSQVTDTPKSQMTVGKLAKQREAVKAYREKAA
ncbi:hypothetical protein K1B30_004539 [Vibrio parahaemolyticus]|nr:hypothetical protein [Vibrio parahaemolyticus]EIU6803922.1 hypothetical protein [Vibrio parahaemolyticus]